MKVFSAKIFKTLSGNLTEAIPSGFIGLFAQTDGFYFKRSNNVVSKLVCTSDAMNAVTLSGYPYYSFSFAGHTHSFNELTDKPAILPFPEELYGWKY